MSPKCPACGSQYERARGIRNRTLRTLRAYIRILSDPNEAADIALHDLIGDLQDIEGHGTHTYADEQTGTQQEGPFT